MKKLFILLLLFFWVAACTRQPEKLPVFGKTTIVGNETLHSTIRPFSFVNQDSLTITEKTFDGKIYVTDFIFLSCQGICPVMTQQLKRVYDLYASNPHIYFLSHSIDPANDTIPRLKAYADELGIDHEKWSFVTGDKDSIFSMASDSYFATAFADSTAPGGFIHSGVFLLIDTRKHIRGAYDGTNPEVVDQLMEDIEILLAEEFP
ncbi:MAG: SCO family protein [Bacteroidales bacterium]|jgi:protein SCO1/2|nr:SCO family protein [Bacteroidales bacterium]